MTVLELALGLGWGITAMYWFLDHLFCIIRKEELVERLERCEEAKVWLQRFIKRKEL